MKMENNELSSNTTTSGQCLKTTHEHSEFLFWGKDPGLSYSAFFSYRREKITYSCFIPKTKLFSYWPEPGQGKDPKKKFVFLVKLLKKPAYILIHKMCWHSRAQTFVPALYCMFAQSKLKLITFPPFALHFLAQCYSWDPYSSFFLSLNGRQQYLL